MRQYVFSIFLPVYGEAKIKGYAFSSILCTILGHGPGPYGGLRTPPSHEEVCASTEGIYHMLIFLYLLLFLLQRNL